MSSKRHAPIRPAARRPAAVNSAASAIARQVAEQPKTLAPEPTGEITAGVNELRVVLEQIAVANDDLRSRLGAVLVPVPEGDSIGVAKSIASTDLGQQLADMTNFARDVLSTYRDTISRIAI